MRAVAARAIVAAVMQNCQNRLERTSKCGSPSYRRLRSVIGSSDSPHGYNFAYAKLAHSILAPTLCFGSQTRGST